MKCLLPLNTTKIHQAASKFIYTLYYIHVIKYDTWQSLDNGGVGSLQVATHRKPVLTLLRMRDILARMMRRRSTLTLASLQCSTTSRRRNVGSGGMRRSILATDFRSADTFY
jgi:hypothetical protein